MPGSALNIKIDDELKTRVQAKAKEYGISMSAFISLVLTEAVNNFQVSISNDYNKNNYSIYNSDFVDMVRESQKSYNPKTKSYTSAKESFDDILGKDWDK
jgi:addiction module RelB/DinJ family antitoxin